MVVTSHLFAEINNITRGDGCHFLNGRHKLKMIDTCTDTYDTLIHDVFGNTFSIIYAPQNLDIESKSKDLRLLVSEIDVGPITL